MGNKQIYHWELESGDQSEVISVDWAAILNGTVLAIELAEAGGGIGRCLENGGGSGRKTKGHSCVSL